jgi:hypothetical protein
VKTLLTNDISGIKDGNIIGFSISGGSTSVFTRAWIMTGHIPALVASVILMLAPNGFTMTK